MFPKGVVNIVCGRGESVGAPLVSHPRVRMVSLTGDVSTGQKILAAAAGNLKRTHLELGGKAPVIVFDDADLEAVVSGVRTFGFYNAGQDCTAACRIYAGGKIYDRLVADLSEAVRSLKVGLQSEAGVEMGPLISAEQRTRVAGFVERAAADAACGNHGRRQGSRRRRVLLRTDLGGRHEAVRRDRAAGGVRARGLGDSVHRCRGGGRLGERFRIRPGLLGLDPDVAKAMSVAARLQYGCTWINTHFMLVSEMPHGGFKRSGYGKDLSVYALEDYTVPRHVMMKL